MAQRRKKRATTVAAPLSSEAQRSHSIYLDERRYAMGAVDEQPEVFLGMNGKPIKRGDYAHIYRDGYGDAVSLVLVWTDPVASLKYPGGWFRYRVVGTTSMGAWRCVKARACRASYETGETIADAKCWQLDGLTEMWEPWDGATQRADHIKQERTDKREAKAAEKKRTKRRAKHVCQDDLCGEEALAVPDSNPQCPTCNGPMEKK